MVMRWKVGFALTVVCLAAAVIGAEPVKPFSPLDTVETLAGRVDVFSEDHRVTVLLTGEDGSGERLFEVEVIGRAALPQPFTTDSAQVLYWRGHLVVIAPGIGKALHFSIPGHERGKVPLLDAERPVRNSAELDQRLRSRYELTRIKTVAAIGSRSGPRALLHDDEELLRQSPLEKIFYQDPNPPPGDGSCGSSCNTACRDGSTCSVTCGPNRCAKCSCPAACVCV
jgi:hypothetical protein